MKKSAIFGAIVAAMMGAFTMCANTNGELNTCSMAREYEQQQNLGPHDGMFFSSRGVVDNICYNDESDNGAYYLIYDDMDAGMDYEAIRVSKQTYQTVLNCLESRTEVVGTLKATKDFETVVYELKCEE